MIAYQAPVMEGLFIAFIKPRTVPAAAKVGHGNQPQSPILEHSETKFRVSHSDIGVPDRRPVVRGYHLSWSTVITSPNGVAALAR